MRNLKKFLALALAMVMAFSLMVTANAAHAGTQYNDEDTVTPAFSEAVEVLTGMGVFQGDSGSFRPASNITRAEVAAIIYRLVTGDTGTNKMDLYTTRHPFTDVRADAWYAGYVGYLYNAKIIKGTTATTFNPAGNVTGYEVLAMILRAVGYDKNDEFTGATWTVEVASTATNLQILRDVDSTHYGDTLHLASRRDVVASMLFRTAAYVPMVQYTLAFGYQNTGMEGGVVGDKLNPTLGWKNFGLTWDTGIVVGNQATGEKSTKIGYTVAFDNEGYYRFTDVSYAYGQNAADTADSPNGKTTIEYTFPTGLELFGHKVNAWYNGKVYTGSVTYHVDTTDSNVTKTLASKYATYAVVDKASMDRTVFAHDSGFDTDDANVITLRDAAKAAGFSANTQTKAYISDRYSQFSTTKLGTNTDIAGSKVGMYRLISNSGTGVDAVIALNQEVGQITQVNTTINGGYYIYLGNGGSNFGAELSNSNKGLILFDQLSGASVKTLGTLVTANQIVGTTKIYNDDAQAHTYDNAGNVDIQYVMYETKKLEPSMTGTIATYRVPDGKTNVSSLTLTDGTRLDLSGITGSYDPFSFDTYGHLINGVTRLTDGRHAGVTYSFYIDEVGRFIGVTTTSDYSFLYATFADYQMGNLGTGTIGYYAYGVDWDGNIVKDKQINSITIPYDDDDDGIIEKTTFLGGGLSTGYNQLPITMKNQGNITSGNEIWQGDNTRFMMNAAGNMSWYPEGGKYGNRFMGFDKDNADGQIPGVDNHGGANVDAWTWEITSNDVVNGFARVYGANALTSANQNAYLLTNATKFIVVTGSGTADLSVKIYNGIGELVGNGSSAAISVGWDATRNMLTGDNVYFLTSADKYGNVDTNDNYTIDTVILSDTNLNNYAAQSLFFSAPGNEATTVKLAGSEISGHTINQYLLYSGGQAGYYWIDETASGDGVSLGNANGTDGIGDFYQLTPINTINGQTIYRAVNVTASRSVAVDATYDYVVVNDMSTAEITFSDLTKQVFKVTGANVTLALGDNDDADFRTLFPSGVNINNIQTLNHAVSMGHANTSGNLYKVSVAIVFSGINMVDIYVTNIA